jgi:outer membrane beta-barrel protein
MKNLSDSRFQRGWSHLRWVSRTLFRSRLRWVVLLVSLLAHSGVIFASENEYSFNWLDPDKKVYVIQNRKYRKARSLLLSALGETGLSNPYKTTYNLDLKAAYFISEVWGVELFYVLSSNSDNSILRALGLASPSVLPKIRQINSLMGGTVQFIPFYAKMNLFDWIVYFDWYFGLGIASIQSAVDFRSSVATAPQLSSQNLLGIVLSTGHEYHLSSSWIVRFDITDVLYSAPINGVTGESSWYSNFTIGLGLGWKL